MMTRKEINYPAHHTFWTPVKRCHTGVSRVADRIFVGSKFDFEDFLQHRVIDYSVVDCSGTSALALPLSVPNYITNYIPILWPDRGVPPLPPRTWLALFSAIGARPIVFLCLGGHGRSGTAAAIAYSYLYKVPPEKAVEAVRRKHCAKAIETDIQEMYVRHIVVGLNRLRETVQTTKENSR